MCFNTDSDLISLFQGVQAESTRAARIKSPAAFVNNENQMARFGLQSPQASIGTSSSGPCSSLAQKKTSMEH